MRDPGATGTIPRRVLCQTGPGFLASRADRLRLYGIEGWLRNTRLDPGWQRCPDSRSIGSKKSETAGQGGLASDTPKKTAVQWALNPLYTAPRPSLPIEVIDTGLLVLVVLVNNVAGLEMLVLVRKLMLDHMHMTFSRVARGPASAIKPTHGRPKQ